MTELRRAQLCMPRTFSESSKPPPCPQSVFEHSIPNMNCTTTFHKRMHHQWQRNSQRNDSGRGAETKYSVRCRCANRAEGSGQQRHWMEGTPFRISLANCILFEWWGGCSLCDIIGTLLSYSRWLWRVLILTSILFHWLMEQNDYKLINPRPYSPGRSLMDPDLYDFLPSALNLLFIF